MEEPAFNFPSLINVMWFGRRLLRSLGESAIWRGSFHSQRSTEIPGRSSQATVLTVSLSFYLGRCESPLGNYSNHSHEPLGATPLRLPAAPEIHEVGVKCGGALSQTCSRRPHGDGYRAVALRIKRSRSR